MDLLDIDTLVLPVILDLRYATDNNITAKKLYSADFRARLDGRALQALGIATRKAQTSGYKVVVWDAYRPPSVQAELRKVCNDDKYVAKESNHSKGVAVDVTLADEFGNLVDMGSDFDDFSDASNDITDRQRQNRELLRRAFVSSGFTANEYEWWHFDYAGGTE